MFANITIAELGAVVVMMVVLSSWGDGGDRDEIPFNTHDKCEEC